MLSRCSTAHLFEVVHAEAGRRALPDRLPVRAVLCCHDVALLWLDSNLQGLINHPGLGHIEYTASTCSESRQQRRTVLIELAFAAAVGL